MTDEIKILKSNDVKKLRDEILKEQKYKCAICGKDISCEDGISLDHQHKLNKMQKNGDDGAGLIRGVLCRECNVYEGKIWNNGSRYKQFKSVSERIEFLKKLINYYSKDNYNILHPNEREKDKVLSKKNFNKVLKLFKIKYPNRKPLIYPKSKKLTSQMKKYFDEFSIDYYNEK